MLDYVNMGEFVLTEDNLVMYAMKKYNNPGCLSVKEFYDDLKRIKYIKRLLNKYNKTGILKERLILNHLVILFNVFDIEAAIKILFFKCDVEFWPALKTFLVYLNYMPEYISGISNTRLLISSDIPLDMKVVKTLRGI